MDGEARRAQPDGWITLYRPIISKPIRSWIGLPIADDWRMETVAPLARPSRTAALLTASPYPFLRWAGTVDTA